MDRGRWQGLKAVLIGLVLLASALPGVASAELRIASWNIQNMGWGEHKRFDLLAEVMDAFDLVAVQEVMNAEAAYRLHGKLEATSGERWGLVYSDRQGRTRYQEKYAYYWRESAARFTGEAFTALDPQDVFVRPPMVARFVSERSGERLVLATLHAIYGNTVAERQGEARALRALHDFVIERFAEGDPLVILGDFNLPPRNPAWAELTAVMEPLITEGATTVSTIEGRMANLYDNIFVPRSNPPPLASAGIVMVHEALGITNAMMRAQVSDHVPVYARLTGAPAIGPIARADGVDPGRQADNDAEHAPDHRAPGSGGAVRGNRNSRVFHRPDCPSYSRVGEANRVHFESAAAALSAGYRLAGNCP